MFPRHFFMLTHLNSSVEPPKFLEPMGSPWVPRPELMAKFWSLGSTGVGSSRGRLAMARVVSAEPWGVPPAMAMGQAIG